MREEELKEYRGMLEEIVELKKKIRQLGKGDELVDNSVVFDYRNGYAKPQSVVGIDQEKYHRTRDRLEHRIEKLRDKCERIEVWIESIEDCETRRIFRMKYIDGRSQQWIGQHVHLAQSEVSRRIRKYIEAAG